MTENTIDNDVTMGGTMGALLAGRYRVVRQLGQGGMGSVWLAEDTQLDDRKVAIKMLPSILVANKRAYQQLKAEALVSLKLTHPNIATLRAFEENGGNPFLVVDYIDGQTLDDYLAEKGKLTEEETIRLLTPVAAALDYAHSKSVVHRDVKPANVMIAMGGTPYVLDFGIAREIQETLTRVTGKLSSGTLLYMSPEQLNGDAPPPAQDVYSFSAMAYECLTGAPPFVRGAIEDQIKNKVPAPLDPHIAISGLVTAGLAKDSANRPTSCAAVLTAGQSKVVDAKRPSIGKKPLVALCVAGVLLAAGLVGVFGWQNWQRQQEAERARIAEQARIAAERKVAEEKRKADEAEAKRKAEEERKAREQATRIAVERAAAEEKRKTDEAEARRKAEEERKAREEAARIAAERKKVAEENARHCAAALAAFENEDWKVALDEAFETDLNAPEVVFKIGWCYAKGRGVAKDETEAAKWFRKAAEQGYATAQCYLGAMYASGRGVAMNYVEAVKWYRKAAEQGDAIAQNNLGERYENGRGVVKDYVEAVKWYRKAAEQGDADAQFSLGVMYEDGRGVAKDEAEAVKWYRKAAKWYRKAAEQGDADAQFSLGVMYEDGRGVAKDEAEAVKWYRKADKQGHSGAKKVLKQLGR